MTSLDLRVIETFHKDLNSTLAFEKKKKQAVRCSRDCGHFRRCCALWFQDRNKSTKHLSLHSAYHDAAETHDDYTGQELMAVSIGLCLATVVELTMPSQSKENLRQIWESQILVRSFVLCKRKESFNGAEMFKKLSYKVQWVCYWVLEHCNVS